MRKVYSINELRTFWGAPITYMMSIATESSVTHSYTCQREINSYLMMHATSRFYSARILRIVLQVRKIAFDKKSLSMHRTYFVKEIKKQKSLKIFASLTSMTQMGSLLSQILFAKKSTVKLLLVRWFEILFKKLCCICSLHLMA